MHDMYSIDNYICYKDIEYYAVEYLQNNLVLCVKKADIEKGDFPLSTVIVPLEPYYSKK